MLHDQGTGGHYHGSWRVVARGTKAVLCPKVSMEKPIVGSGTITAQQSFARHMLWEKMHNLFSLLRVVGGLRSFYSSPQKLILSELKVQSD